MMASSSCCVTLTAPTFAPTPGGGGVNCSTSSWDFSFSHLCPKDMTNSLTLPPASFVTVVCNVSVTDLSFGRAPCSRRVLMFAKACLICVSTCSIAMSSPLFEVLYVAWVCWLLTWYALGDSSPLQASLVQQVLMVSSNRCLILLYW